MLSVSGKKELKALGNFLCGDVWHGTIQHECTSKDAGFPQTNVAFRLITTFLFCWSLIWCWICVLPGAEPSFMFADASRHLLFLQFPFDSVFYVNLHWSLLHFATHVIKHHNLYISCIVFNRVAARALAVQPSAVILAWYF